MGPTSFALVRQRMSQLKDLLTQNPEQNHTEAFKEVFGKEKAGRVCCYGRNVTPTALKQKEKQNQIMDSMKQEHAVEVNSLKSEQQDVKQQMLGMQSFIKVWMQQNNSGMNMENLDVFFRSFPSEANNAQNDEGQCNEHSTTHASNPDKNMVKKMQVFMKLIDELKIFTIYFGYLLIL
ncbi:uncharacterized protein G2W53_044652 [Senna tora]|uniref:Uncharacterized protein n=1 Tax=Senna tora TaxID=362788 RepID=A0A834W1J1_9FABA|nr:uncharacterized protein G2W53_044652 [Senna tora]